MADSAWFILLYHTTGPLHWLCCAYTYLFCKHVLNIINVTQNTYCPFQVTEEGLISKISNIVLVNLYTVFIIFIISLG